MTLETFKRTVTEEMKMLALFGQDADIEEVICAFPEWHHKWAEALLGKYDA